MIMSDQQQGKLPEDFPGHAALAEAGINTLAQARKQRDSEEGLTGVAGIGDATAEKIKEALAAAPPADPLVTETAAPGEQPAPPSIGHGFDTVGGVPVAHETRAAAVEGDTAFAAREGAASTESGEPAPPPPVTEGNRALVMGQKTAPVVEEEPLPVFTKHVMRTVNRVKVGTFSAAEIANAPESD